MTEKYQKWNRDAGWMLQLLGWQSKQVRSSKSMILFLRCKARSKNQAGVRVSRRDFLTLRGSVATTQNFNQWRPVASIFHEISASLEMALDGLTWLENHWKLVSEASGSFLDQSSSISRNYKNFQNFDIVVIFFTFYEKKARGISFESEDGTKFFGSSD